MTDRTVRNLADRGVLRPLRLTPRSPRRFLAEDVDRLLEEMDAQLTEGDPADPTAANAH